MKKNNDNISKLCSAYCFAHLHRASTQHSISVKWVGADTISFLSLCGGFPFPTPPKPRPRRRANTQTNSRGVFHGTIPASAGLWSHSGLATVSSLGQPILVSLLPKNGTRNPFLRGPAALQTPSAPEAHHQVCTNFLLRVHWFLYPAQEQAALTTQDEKTLC